MVKAGKGKGVKGGMSYALLNEGSSCEQETCDLATRLAAAEDIVAVSAGQGVGDCFTEA